MLTLEEFAVKFDVKERNHNTCYICNRKDITSRTGYCSLVKEHCGIHHNFKTHFGCDFFSPVTPDEYPTWED